MTSILGLVHDGEVWIAGDSALSTERMVVSCAEPKVWIKDGMVWGHAGDVRPGDVIRHCLKTAKPPKKPDDVDRFVHAELIPEMRNALVKDGLHWDEEELAIEFLVGISGQLYEINLHGHSLYAARTKDGFNAIGTAYDAGQVGLKLMSNLSPRHRLVRVLNAIASFHPGVRGPFHVVKV